MRIIKVIATAFMFIPVAHADPVDIPNQLPAGLPALAEDVNENFEALEMSVDDNAHRIEALEAAVQTAGPQVRVGGIVVGRFVSHGTGFLTVALPGGGTERAAEAVGFLNATRLFVQSPTGYTFELLTDDRDHPFLGEGHIDTLNIYFQTTDCTGPIYRPVAGDTGFLSVFVPGTNMIQPMKQWVARQGIVFASPDPNDPNPVYMVRRGGQPEIVPIQSFLVYAPVLGRTFCVPMTNIPGYDPGNPQHVNHTVFAVEPLDSAEAGVSGQLGGSISVGL